MGGGDNPGIQLACLDSSLAIAPLFIIWFGFGLFPKLLIVFLLCFFPIVVSSVAGFVPPVERSPCRPGSVYVMVSSTAAGSST